MISKLKPFLVWTILAILGGSALADWLGPDVVPPVHRAEPVRLEFPISGSATTVQSGVLPLVCVDNTVFPGNFTGPFPDGTPIAKCGTNNNELDTYLIKVNGTQIGQVALTGASGGTLVQQGTCASGTTTCDVAMGSNVSLGNYLIVAYAEESNSFNPTFTLNAGTATIGAVTTCPGSGTPIEDAGGLASSELAFAKVTGTGSVTIRATLGGAETHVMNVSEWSGLASSSVLDVCGAGTTSANTPGTAVQTGTTGSTTNTSDLIIGTIGQHATSATLSGLTAGYAQLTAPTISAETAFGVYQNVAATSNYSASGTSSVSGTWAGIIMALKASSNTSACIPTFTTTNGQPQFCPAGGYIEVDVPAIASGSNLVFALPGHVP